MTVRAHIGLETKLASALLALGHIPYDDAKEMTARQLCSLYTFDHGILHALKPIDDFWNLTPRLITPHRRKSASDTAIVAKVKRIARVTAEASRRLLAKHQGEPAPEQRRSQMQSRGFQKDTRPKGQRGFQRRRSR